jgi:hypothetical protein
MKYEFLKLVSKTADGVWAIIGAMQSLEENDGEIFHTFPFSKDRCVRFFWKI